MAKTHHVKAFRGQRKCQYVVDDSDWSKKRCNRTRAEHESGVFEEGQPVQFLTHEFTQAPLKCQHCGKPINIGDPYKWVAPRTHRAARGRRMNRHTSCPGWKPSELTSSVRLQILYSAQETAEKDLEALGDPIDPEDAESFLEDLRAILEGSSEEARAAAEHLEESASNMEEGFGHSTYQSDEMNDQAQEINDWCDSAMYVTFEDFDEEPECNDCGAGESEDCHQDPEDDEYHDFESNAELQLADWAEEQRSQVYDHLTEIPI